MRASNRACARERRQGARRAARAASTARRAPNQHVATRSPAARTWSTPLPRADPTCARAGEDGRARRALPTRAPRRVAVMATAQRAGASPPGATCDTRAVDACPKSSARARAVSPGSREASASGLRTSADARRTRRARCCGAARRLRSSCAAADQRLERPRRGESLGESGSARAGAGDEAATAGAALSGELRRRLMPPTRSTRQDRAPRGASARARPALAQACGRGARFGAGCRHAHAAVRGRPAAAGARWSIGPRVATTAPPRPRCALLQSRAARAEAARGRWPCTCRRASRLRRRRARSLFVACLRAVLSPPAVASARRCARSLRRRAGLDPTPACAFRFRRRAASAAPRAASAHSARAGVRARGGRRSRQARLATPGPPGRLRGGGERARGRPPGVQAVASQPPRRRHLLAAPFAGQRATPGRGGVARLDVARSTRGARAPRGGARWRARARAFDAVLHARAAQGGAARARARAPGRCGRIARARGAPAAGRARLALGGAFGADGAAARPPSAPRAPPLDDAAARVKLAGARRQLARDALNRAPRAAAAGRRQRIARAAARGGARRGRLATGRRRAAGVRSAGKRLPPPRLARVLDAPRRRCTRPVPRTGARLRSAARGGASRRSWHARRTAGAAAVVDWRAGAAEVNRLAAADTHRRECAATARRPRQGRVCSCGAHRLLRRCSTRACRRSTGRPRAALGS